MGISIIIAHEHDEVLNTDYFVEQLRKKWPEVKIHFIADSDAPLLQFETPDDFRILGDFLGTGVSYKSYGRAEDIEFAQWYRTVVPPEWDLRVYDSALTFDFIFLTTETTREQIMAGFNVPFDYSKYE